MTARILTSNTYHDEVRGKLGVTEDVLPDTAIDFPTFLNIAEARVIDRVAQFCDYTTLQGDDQTFLYGAAVCMVASLLATSMPSRMMKSEGDTDYKYTRNDVDWNQKAKDLEDEAYSCIDYISVQPVVELPQIAASGPTRKHHHGSRSIRRADEYFFPGSYV